MTAYLVAIVSRTPLWVWFLLAALIALGLTQMRQRSVPRQRVILLPVVLAVLSLAGVASTFGLRAAVEGPWLAGGLLGFVIARFALPAPRASYQADGRFLVAGSAWPLAMMMAVFFVRYAVNVMLAIAPARAQDLGFAAIVALLYALPAGLMAGRAQRILATTRSGGPALA